MMALKNILILTAGALALCGCGNTGDIAAQPDRPETAAPVTGSPATTDPEKRETMTEPPNTGNEANYARDGNIAIQEEFQDAELKGTVEAYEMFIARHPEHELTKLAKIRIAEIKAKKGK